jgi:hypothetical protein
MAGKWIGAKALSFFKVIFQAGYKRQMCQKGNRNYYLAQGISCIMPSYLFGTSCGHEQQRLRHAR